MSGWRKRQVSDLIECQACLEMLFPKQPELINTWWHSPNKAFEMRPPREVFNGGGSERVLGYLKAQFNGDFS